MAGINIQELDGSPEIDMDRAGGSANRTVLIDYDDLFPFLNELFPEDPYSGYQYAASFPAPLPWLVADSVKIRPFGRMWGLNENPAKYDFWKINVGYRTSNVDQKMAPGSGLDQSGPGEDEGSSGGQTSDSGVKFLSHKVKMGGEFLLIPNRAMRWEKDSAGTTYDEPEENDSNVALNNENRVGKIIPLLEHNVTWSYVNYPPWKGIRNCIGCVNDRKFLGTPKSCLLFLGAEASREYSLKDKSYWNLTYNLSEKIMNYKEHQLGNGIVAQGWNHFFRQETGRIELLLRKGQAGKKVGVYLEDDFRQLFTRGTPLP